jgi:hypothetical protein
MIALPPCTRPAEYARTAVVSTAFAERPEPCLVRNHPPLQAPAVIPPADYDTGVRLRQAPAGDMHITSLFNRRQANLPSEQRGRFHVMPTQLPSPQAGPRSILRPSLPARDYHGGSPAPSAPRVTLSAWSTEKDCHGRITPVPTRGVAGL